MFNRCRNLLKTVQGWNILQTKRDIATTSAARKYHRPIESNTMPRSGGISSMMRLPVKTTAAGLDACFVGVPMDCGASYKPGTRLGPRHVRVESVLIRPVNAATGASPFESLVVADVGDVPTNMFNIHEACKQIRLHFADVLKHDCKPIAIGGDHTITYPILQAIKEKHGPVGLIHVDAHSDTSDSTMGEKVEHGTHLRRSVEDGCVDTNRVIQIGLRESWYSPFDYMWPRKQVRGFE
ncbi:agmatinase, mitochondrial-like [Gigantopelta aegis]|uniref:agmatinase, mitochondrial-like n=1 Tax=Gigantopelta aegis TaxID=1735272 RepID=UPI001B887853|nr:agmatinase, mitochondrial-like [Gigantopelta aegis]